MNINELFKLLFDKYRDLSGYMPDQITGLLLLKSSSGQYHLKALKKWDSICGTNQFVDPKWSHALYMTVLHNRRSNSEYGLEEPLTMFREEEPSCEHKTYSRIDDFRDLDIDKLSHTDISYGHTGIRIRSANRTF